MSDPQQQQQDPLAALEELLKDSKGAAGDSAVPNDPAKADLAAKQAEEQKEQEIKALEKAQKEKDAEALRLQIADLQGIAQTPQEQARLAQKEQEHEEQKTQASQQTEYQIRQLGHTKI